MQLVSYLQAMRLMLCLVLLGTGSGVYAQDSSQAAGDSATALTEQQQALQQAIADEQATLSAEQDALRDRENALPQQLQQLQTREIDASVLGQAQTDVEAAQSWLAELNNEIDTATTVIEQLQTDIKALETREQLLQNPARQDDTTGADRSAQLQRTRDELASQRTTLRLENNRLESLHKRQELASARLDMAQQWLASVIDANQRQQSRHLEDNQKNQLNRLQQQLESHKNEANRLKQRLEQPGLSETRQQQLRMQLREANYQEQLAQFDINLFTTQSALNQLKVLAEQPDPGRDALWEGQQQLASLRSELQQQKEEINDRLAWVSEQQQTALAQREGAAADEQRRWDEVIDSLDTFRNALTERQENVQAQMTRLESISDQLTQRFTEVLRADLLYRKTPPMSLSAWQELLNNLFYAPRVLFYQTRLSLESALEAISKDTNPLRWAGFLALGLGFAVLLMVARRGLRGALQRLENQQEVSYAGQLTRGSAELLQENYVAVSFVSTVLLAIWIFQVPQPGQGIIATIALVGLGTKVAIDLAQWLLVSSRLTDERRDPSLYRRWFISLLAGGVLATLTILAHLSAISEGVISFFEWLCMLYLLLINGPVLKARRYYIEQLIPHYAGRNWFVSLRLFTLGLPLSLLGAAFVGLVGYINLAWTIAWYLGIFIMTMTGLWILRGLLNDLVMVLKNFAVAHSSYGLLWTQEIIRPIHLSLRIALLIGAAWVLSLFYGWTDIYMRNLAVWQPVLLATIGALFACVGLFILAGLYVAQTQSTTGGALIRHTRQPLTLLLPATAALLTLSNVQLEQTVSVKILQHGLLLVIIVAVAWGAISLISALEEVVEQRYRIDAKDNDGARRVQTQVRILRRIMVVGVYLIAISAMLMTFPTIRQLGAGLLASAGVAGLVAGVAARPFLENLIAGIQIGLTQPIRLDDVVIVEGEWGKIAEISATYVVIRIWDQRRLVVPLNYFNTQSFQNWTRSSSELLGTAFFYVDYTFPVDEGRQELKRILDASSLWDGRAWGLQVTDSTAQTVELRALMSAADASIAWDLRCYVREEFIAFLQRNYPHALPKTRAIFEQGALVSQIAHPQRDDKPSASFDAAG